MMKWVRIGFGLSRQINGAAIVSDKDLSTGNPLF
jgi:hypothetical protein